MNDDKNQPKPKTVLKDDSVYVYCEDLWGIPGLPREITGKAAKEKGLDVTLAWAVDAGRYQEKPAAKKKAEKVKE